MWQQNYDPPGNQALSRQPFRLRQRLHQGPSISAAATHAGVSESQLRRLFLKVRSETPLGVLNRFRFERAMSLLSETDYKLQRAALEYGFANATSFCRAFQQHCGFTPSVWRQEIYNICAGCGNQ